MTLPLTAGEFSNGGFGEITSGDYTVALGRKNYLFVGSKSGGNAAAIAYTLIETARMNGINPEEWLTWVLDRVQDHKAKRIEDLMPWNFKSR